MPSLSGLRRDGMWLSTIGNVVGGMGKNSFYPSRQRHPSSYLPKGELLSHPIPLCLLLPWSLQILRFSNPNPPYSTRRRND